jgi:diamine N-acetyltransferase
MFQKPSTEPRSKDLFEQLLSSGDSTVVVAESGVQLVGVATAVLRSAPDLAVFMTQQWGVLDNIAVLESWRRRGVGRSLTREAERWAQSRGAKWLELGVYEFNADARSFYQALGYCPVSTKLRKPFDEAG